MLVNKIDKFQDVSAMIKNAFIPSSAGSRMATLERIQHRIYTKPVENFKLILIL